MKEEIIKYQEHADFDGSDIVVSRQPLVRCKDCKRKNTTACIIYCIGANPRDDWFCANGERKEEE